MSEIENPNSSIKCFNCGEEITDECIYCPHCGIQLRELPPEVAALNLTEEERHTPMPVKLIKKGMINKEDILCSMTLRTLPAFKENQLLMSDNSEYRNTCIHFIEYKVLWSLYEIMQKVDENFTWDDCVIVMKSTPQLLAAAEPIVLYTMENYIAKTGFDYEAAIEPLMDDNEPGIVGDTLRFVELFSDERGEFLYDFFFLNAEVIFYYQQLAAGKKYSWKEYLAEIQRDSSIWDKISAAVLNAFKKMDFKDGWLADDLEEVQFLNKPVEEKTEKERE